MGSRSVIAANGAGRRRIVALNELVLRKILRERCSEVGEEMEPSRRKEDESLGSKSCVAVCLK